MLTRLGYVAASTAVFSCVLASTIDVQAGFNDLMTNDVPATMSSPDCFPVETARTTDPGSPAHHAGRTAGAGLATWYGPGFTGRRTASGEHFNPNAMTAAHRSLPFGTRVEVTDVATGRSVVVRINDRGPHRRGAVIDLSRGSARALGIGGMARVRLVSLSE